MGCGASKDPKIAVVDSQKPLVNKNKNGFKQVEVRNYNDYSRNAPNSTNISKLVYIIKKKN